MPTIALPSLVLGPGILPGRRPAATLTGESAEDAVAGTGKTLVARSRIAPGGGIETLVAAGFADRSELLRLHGAMVQEAIAARRGGRG